MELTKEKYIQRIFGNSKSIGDVRAPNHSCLTCKYVPYDDTAVPCNTCSYDIADGRSNWTPVNWEPSGEKSKHDIVNKPKHYMLMDGLEVRDVLAALLMKMKTDNIPSSVLFESDYVQMMQYLMRFMDKNGKQDLEKARWYLDKMINAYD